MTIIINRRSLVLTGGFGIGALSMDGALHARALLTARGFTHNVASGEPGPDSILLWTRYVPPHGDDAKLTVELSPAPDFKNKTGGSAMAQRAEDHTARAIVRGLEPNRTYYYRFIAPDGTVSPIGRTRTLPVGPVARFGLGILSCANLPFGWFNAYAHAAAREDIDLMVHTGDYIYEYQRGYFPGADKAIADRLIEPAGEAIRLADYRLRYASYRTDPDLQRLHQLFPMIAQHDDHETANDSWQHGAENHQPGEGAYEERKRASMRAWKEWLPVSGAPWSSFELGDLATLFRPETRLTARSERLDPNTAVGTDGDAVAKLVALRDGPLADPKRTLLGAEQERWLFDGFVRSRQRGAKWQIVAQQVVMGQMKVPELPASFADNLKLPPDQASYFRVISAAGKAGIAPDLDSWAGFPAARARLLDAAQAADADLVVLSGDSHNGWAFDLASQGKPVGVEFGGHSVSSPGLEAYLSLPPQAIAQLVVSASPELKWADIGHRGYMAIQITPEKVTGEWVFMDTVATRSLATRPGKTMTVERGRRTFSA